MCAGSPGSSSGGGFDFIGLLAASARITPGVWWSSFQQRLHLQYDLLRLRLGRAFLTMADSLYLSLWFPGFDVEEMMPQAVAVMRQFPFSARWPGISYLALHPVGWAEPTILERRFEPSVEPEQAALVAADLLHEDYAYVFETHWDLWTPGEGGTQWMLLPSSVKFIVHGVEFEDGAFEQEGHVQVDFGLDTPFLHEEVDLTTDTESRVRANVQRLVEFTAKMERNTQANARLLWSESEENLAQKLIARLQKVQ